MYFLQEWWLSITMLVFWGAFPIKEEGPDVFITVHVRYSRGLSIRDPTINNFTLRPIPWWIHGTMAYIMYLIERETYGTILGNWYTYNA